MYLRVSTEGQSLDPQRAEVMRLVEGRGFELVGEYAERSSAWHERTALASLRTDARQGAFDVVVVWALDRFGRRMEKNLADVLELDRLGVQLVSVREPWLDLGGPVRELLIAVFSWVAEQEGRRIGERTRAGLERARAKGIRLGRPPVRVDLDHARRLRATGLTWSEVAGEMGVKETTLERARRAARCS